MTGKDYTIQAVIRAIEVIECLAQGEILEWKSIREVAAATEQTENMSYRVLETLVATGWAEKSAKGYRQKSEELIRHAIYAKEYLDRQYAKLKGTC